VVDTRGLHTGGEKGESPIAGKNTEALGGGEVVSPMLEAVKGT